MKGPISLPSVSGRRPDTANLIRAGLILCLLCGLFAARLLDDYSHTAMMAGMAGLALALAGLHYGVAERPLARLISLVGMLSGLYALFHYPLMPPLPGDRTAQGLYAAIWLVWAGAVAAAVASYWRPSLGLVAPAFLEWAVVMAGHVTGLAHNNMLDTAPLTEVSRCLGLGLAILRAYRLLARRWSDRAALHAACADEFAAIIVWMGICIHLANYFWSAVAKLLLAGPWFGWVRFNNPVYIYLVAQDDQHVLFQDYTSATKLFLEVLDKSHLVTNAIILAAQAIALVGLMMRKRHLIWLLIVFDAMHLAISLAAGANFWPWILLNVAIAAVVVGADYRQPRPAIGLLSLPFILIAPHLLQIARLGWFDSGANNRLYVEAEDDKGRRYFVASNFFTFYSYPFAHMDYGYPGPEQAFRVDNPNGGVKSYTQFKAGQSCDVAVLTSGPPGRGPDPALGRFILDYARMARSIEARLGVFPYNLYPHHFYIRRSIQAPFDALDKDRVTAYIYRRESLCLSLHNGAIRRRLVSNSEMRIEVPHVRDQ